MRSVLVLGLVALAMGALVPSTAEAKPKPGVKKGFRLFAKAIGAMTINRIYCGIASNGQVCVDSTNSPVVGGGFWPKGSPDQYVFNSGMQVAGIIGPDANPEWVGDTTGGLLFSPRGDDHGEEVQPVFNAADPADVAQWPQAALVPLGDATQDLFFPVLRGRVSASQGDVWFVSSEGNPGFAAGREHPLGILVEQRGMGYNFPSGNQDILYFIYTFYNMTASDPAAYAAIRPGMREIVAEAGQRFQQLNEARFAIDIPDGGYTITNMFAAFGADMDVGEAGSNYASVNVPFSLGYTYQNDFSGEDDWLFDPTIFGPPFFPGSGFVGVKYLKSPVVDGVEVGLTLFSNTINQGAFDDAQNMVQQFRYLSNNISTAAGDAACNTGVPQVTRICFINNVAPDDMRFFQSSGPLELAPGQFGSIAVAYIFAAPVSVGACVGPGTCDLTPGDPTRLSDADLLADGANPVDSVAGFAGYEDANADGIVQQEEIATVPGSLLDKAKVAQTIFNNRFLTPAAPESPPFFLIPGNNQVTVLWSPSPTEAAGDPFFQVASEPLVVPEGGGDPVQNPLFDPNFRQFDVEGYRVYRGRVDSPNSLSLLASFDFSGTVMRDFTSQVNSSEACAPELGINAPTAIDSITDPANPDTTFGCPVDFDSLTPGVAPTVFTEIPLVGPIIQVKLGPGGTPGARIPLASGVTINTAADTAITGRESGCLQRGTSATCGLVDNDVPFVYVDETARNNLRYFYSVVAFDINSIQSGPSSIESSRVTKAVTPVAGASNTSSVLDLTPTLVGRGQTLDFEAPTPTLDPATLTFSGPFPPANGWELGFVSSLPEVLAGSGSFSVRLDSIHPGNLWHGEASVYHFTATTSISTIAISVPVAQNFVEPEVTAPSTPFPAAQVDPSAGRFGGSSAFNLYGQVEMTLPGSPYVNGFGRVVALGPQTAGAPALSAENGPRWFEGDNEATPHPAANNAADPSADFNLWSNAGTLSGVTVVHSPQAYLQGIPGVGGRELMGAYAGAARAADFKFYWGAGGAVDSVIDVTHNVVVPFDTAFGGGYGFLTPASATSDASVDASTAVVSTADFWCVAPAPQQGATGDLSCGAEALTQPYRLVPTATLAPIQIGGTVAAVTAPPPGLQGFGLYMPGHTFIFGTSALPAAGTVWTLRTYTGAIAADNTFVEQLRPLTAVGVEAQLQYQATNSVAAPTTQDLSRVHTVPDPYYVTSAFEQTTDAKVIKFVNLPNKAIIRIYSSSGVLVALIEHNSPTFGGSADWSVRNRNQQVVASGVYFYHIEAGDARRVGRFTVVNFAQ
jgi:hypothetical protein